MGHRAAPALICALCLAAVVAAAAPSSTSPSLGISSPRDFQTYTEQVSVEGWVRGTGAGLHSVGGIRRAWWEVLGTSLGGELPLESDGYFAFSFPAPLERVGLLVKVRVEGQGGATISDSVALLRERAAFDLALRSPVEAEYFRETTALSGSLSGPLSEILSLEWSVDGTSLRGDLTPDEAGAFREIVDSSGLRGAATVRVTARTRDGRLVERSVGLRDGMSGPRILVGSPVAGQTYEETVRLEGSVSLAGGPVGVEWRIGGTTLAGRAAVDTGGSFSALIPVGELAGDLLLELTARSENGRTESRSVTLQEEIQEVALELSSPEEDGTYGEEILLQGKAGSPREGAWSTKRVESLTVEVTGVRSFTEEITPDPATGEVDHRIPARDLRGAVLLRVVLRDVAGKEIERSFTLIQQRAATQPAASAPAPAPQSQAVQPVEGPPTVAAQAAAVTAEPPQPAAAAASQPATAQPPEAQPAATTPAVQLTPAPTPQVAVITQAAASPALTLSTPRADSMYKGTVRVSGRLTDGLDAQSVSSRFGPVGWEVVGAERTGSIQVGADGSFSGEAITEGLRGTVLLQVHVAHANGKELARAVALRDDGVGPSLEIRSPAAGAFYLDSISLAGFARDVASDPASAVEVARVRYELRGQSESAGEAAVDPLSGAFQAEIAVGATAGRQALLVTAVDRNGYETSREVAVEDGRSSPVLTLQSPEPQSAYGAYLWVRGTVTIAGEGRADRIQEVAVKVASSGLELASVPWSGAAEIHEDGSFELAVSAAELKGRQKVTVTARARNGASAETIVEIDEGESDLPGFAVRGSDGAAELSWPEAPLVTRYDLRIVEDGKESRQEGVASPLRVEGLSNGELYAFRLLARLSTGEELSSGEERAIPLAPETLGLQARGEYQRIRLSWQPAPGAEAYEIRRAEGSAEPSRIAETGELSYLDTAVQYGREYRYCVLPSRFAQVPSAVASAQTTAFPAERFAAESSVKASSEIRALAVDRSYVYLACGSGGLVVGEVHDLGSPQILATAPLEDARDVALTTLSDGHRYAFVADGAAGLVAVDVTLPAQPEVVGNRMTADARAVEIFSERQLRIAYVADGDSGLKVMDISVAKKPERIASLQVGNLAALCLKAPYLYATGSSSLAVFDVTEPSSPRLLSETPVTGGRGVGVDARDGSVFLNVACGEDGLRIYNATDPRSVRLAGQLDSTLAVAVLSSTQTYVADAQEGILVVDVTDPSSPTLFEAVEIGGVSDIAIEETTDGRQFAFAATAEGLKIVQILVHGRSLELGSILTGGRGYRIELGSLGTSSVFACVADHAGGVRILRLEGIGLPDFSGTSFAIPTTYAYDTAVISIEDRWHLLVADGSGGLKMHDLSEAESAAGARLEGTAFATDARSVAAWSGPAGLRCALVADRREGLRIYDVSFPQAIRQLALLPVSGALDVAVATPPAGASTALVGSPDGLSVVELAADGRATIRGRLTGMSVRRVAVLDSELLLFAAVTGKGVVTVDCSRASEPRVVSTYQTSFGEDVFVSADGLTKRLYVAEGYRGISVLEASSEGELREVSSCPDVYAAAIAGWSTGEGSGYAYVLDTTRLWQIEVLVPRWIERGTAAP